MNANELKVGEVTFNLENFLWVRATQGKGSLSDQSVQSLLLFNILQTLKEQQSPVASRFSDQEIQDLRDMTTYTNLTGHEQRLIARCLTLIENGR